MSQHQYLIKKEDIEELPDHIAAIQKAAQKKKFELVEPHEEEINKVSNIILNFIKENKRKIYGGFALNLLIKDKNPADAIYSDTDIPDIDFYSPEPLKDLVKLCNVLFKSGFQKVRGSESQHRETYNIRVGGQLYCDISYVPRNIYNRMPYREINGLNVIGPEFMLVDYFRLITDMISSTWRLEKTVKRMYLLQKYYPLPYIKTPIDIKLSTIPEEKVILENLLDVIFNYIQNNKALVVVGFYAYDQFLKASSILKSNSPNAKKFKYLEVPYYEIIVDDYKAQTNQLLDLLKKKYSEIESDIHVTEHYPFFQFWGYFCLIYYKDKVIAKIFSNNKKCTPLIVLPAYKFQNNKFLESDPKNTVNIGSFSTVMLNGLITVFKARVDQDKNLKDLYYTFLSHLMEMRNYFFNSHKKTIYDNTPFKEFVMDCTGVPITPDQERQLLFEYRKKHKKYTFKYEPSEDGKPTDLNFIFANSSGNPINNNKNLKLTPEAKEKVEVGDEESEEPESDNVNVVNPEKLNK
ncbi:MAG: hypothetical protein Hyperionvirus20_23 [Hyperionvirus sp.]|uniref:Putative poly(A) polymerase catalytic subunit n=1 Tax=Hyperionvirus sp. TaxID=2487770 RepID=A0A3G5AAI3_9VIRU|nr:MAG: hypothetical protein Hyperionvirus20_23 [Hyperionvirus sp.]